MLSLDVMMVDEEAPRLVFVKYSRRTAVVANTTKEVIFKWCCLHFDKI